MLYISAFDLLNFHPSFDPVGQAQAFLASAETAPNISRPTWAISHNPAGKVILCHLVRHVVKVDLIITYVLLPLWRKASGLQYQSHGKSFAQASKHSAHLESLENWAAISTAKLILLHFLLLLVFARVKLTQVCKDVLQPHQSTQPGSLENGSAVSTCKIHVPALPIIARPNWHWCAKMCHGDTFILLWRNTFCHPRPYFFINERLLVECTDSSSGIWYGGKGPVPAA